MSEPAIDDDGGLARPAGTGNYAVQPGDCFSSIADQHGFFWETLWNLPENAAVKEARGDPNILLPGDAVAVPERRRKLVRCASGAKHVFRRRGVPEKIHLKLTQESLGDRKGIAYELFLDGANEPRRGVTTEEGMVEEWIPPDAMTGRLLLENGEEIPLAFGRLDPVDSISGARARLVNLRLMMPGEEFELALDTFQQIYGLEPTMQLDEPTRAKLVELYGC